MYKVLHNLLYTAYTEVIPRSAGKVQTRFATKAQWTNARADTKVYTDSSQT